jgi:hypothetical protein
METNMQTSKELVDKIFIEKNEPRTTSGMIFQELLYKFQQLQKNNNDYQNCIRQEISLCSELIDTIEKSTPADVNDFQDCLEILNVELSVFEGISVKIDAKLFVREIFFALLDLLCKPQLCLYLNDDQHTVILHKKCYERLTHLLLTSATPGITFIPFKKEDITIRKYTDMLSAMYKRVERDLQMRNSTEQPESEYNPTTEFILSFLWNLVDRTIILPWLLGIGLSKSMLKCLKITNLSSETVRSIIPIIHNIARHDDGAEELRKLDGLSIIKDFRTFLVYDLDDQTNLVLSMAIALLSTSEQIRSDNKRMNKILNQLLQLIIEAAEVSFTKKETNPIMSLFLQ